MEIITCLNSDPRQRFNITVEGTTLYVNLYYYQTQKSWFFDIEYGDLICKGMRVCLTPNALRHFINIIPFGIGFLSDNLAEPYALDDFATGRVSMVILSQDDVNEIEQGAYDSN